MSIADGKIVESCGVWLDARQLPVNATDTSDDMVVLSPIEIAWGVSQPWDTPVAAVATLTLIDPKGRYAASVRALNGKRITIRPLYDDWAYSTNAAAADNLAYYAVFDGYITEAKIDTSQSTPRIKITAADKLRNAARDTRQWPNSGIEAKYAKGYQGWTIGTTNTISDRLKSVGIPYNIHSYSTYPVPYEATEKVSTIDMLSGIRTQLSGSRYYWRYSAPPYLSYFAKDEFSAPTYSQYGFVYNPRFALVDGGTAYYVTIENQNRTETPLTDSYMFIDAGKILCDKSAVMSVPQKITDLKLGFYHRTLTNSNATDDQRAQEATYYTWSQDGERLVTIEESTVAADKNILEFTTRWTDYTGQTQFSSVDVSGLVDSIRESNQRIRLPEISMRSDKLQFASLFATAPKLFTFFASKFETINADTHGAWLSLGGTLAYDATRKKGRWTNTITDLWPLPDVIAQQSVWPTFADWRQMSSADTFAQGTWKLGVLRYTNEVRKQNERS